MKKKLEQFRLPVELAEALEDFAEASKLSKTEIVINALQDQMAKGTESRLVSRLSAVRKIRRGLKPRISSKIAGDDAASKFVEAAKNEVKNSGREVASTTVLSEPPKRLIRKRSTPLKH